MIGTPGKLTEKCVYHGESRTLGLGNGGIDIRMNRTLAAPGRGIHEHESLFTIADDEALHQALDQSRQE